MQIVSDGVSISFNPRAPYGARHSKSRLKPSPSCFNPRAPYGARLGDTLKADGEVMFQPTRPVRGAARRPDVRGAFG